MTQTDHWLVDKRVVKRHIQNNLLTEKEFKSHLSSLRDLSSSAEEIEIGDELEQTEKEESTHAE